MLLFIDSYRNLTAILRSMLNQVLVVTGPLKDSVGPHSCVILAVFLGAWSFFVPGQQASSRKSPRGSKLLPFMGDGGHCAHLELQYCRNVCVLFPRSVPQSCVRGLQIVPGLHGLVYTCTVNYGVSVVTFQVIIHTSVKL